MSTSRFCKQPWRVLWTAVAVMLLSAGLTQAGKPSGGGGTVPAGRIHFFGTDIGVMTSMKADGSDKAPLPGWEPSRRLHNDVNGQARRWFLDVRETPELGSYPPQGTEGVVWPRQEVFAVRDDGYAVQLTDDPFTRPAGSNTGLLRWSHSDTFISSIGVQWDENGTERGVIFRAALAFVDGIPELVEAPTVWMDSGVWKDGGFTYPDLQGHDWSPLGDQLVFGEVLGGDIWVAGGVFPEVYVTTFGILDGPTTVLRAYGKYPEWSLQGRIAYLSFDTIKGWDAGLRTMGGDGSAPVQVTGGSDRFPTWSPDGNHLAFARTSYTNKNGTRTYIHDVMRVPATGGTAVNLTKDIDGGILIVAAWRSS